MPRPSTQVKFVIPLSSQFYNVQRTWQPSWWRHNAWCFTLAEAIRCPNRKPPYIDCPIRHRQCISYDSQIIYGVPSLLKDFLRIFWKGQETLKDVNNCFVGHKRYKRFTQPLDQTNKHSLIVMINSIFANEENYLDKAVKCHVSKCNWRVFFQNSLSPLFGQIELRTLYTCL